MRIAHGGICHQAPTDGLELMAGAMQRYALEPFTFSNGQTVPAGTMLACPALALHIDDAHYAAPADTFDPWRHSGASAENGEAHRNMLVTTRPDYIPFGHGADAWYVFILDGRCMWGVR